MLGKRREKERLRERRIDRKIDGGSGIEIGREEETGGCGEGQGGRHGVEGWMKGTEWGAGMTVPRLLCSGHSHACMRCNALI